MDIDTITDKLEIVDADQDEIDNLFLYERYLILLVVPWDISLLQSARYLDGYALAK